MQDQVLKNISVIYTNMSKQIIFPDFSSLEIEVYFSILSRLVWEPWVQDSDWEVAGFIAVVLLKKVLDANFFGSMMTGKHVKPKLDTHNKADKCKTGTTDSEFRQCMPP